VSARQEQAQEGYKRDSSHLESSSKEGISRNRLTRISTRRLDPARQLYVPGNIRRKYQLSWRMRTKQYRFHAYLGTDTSMLLMIPIPRSLRFINLP
jgi:hypothetical protein